MNYKMKLSLLLVVTFVGIVSSGCRFRKPPPPYGYPGYPNYGYPGFLPFYNVVYLPNGTIILYPQGVSTSTVTTARTTVSTTTSNPFFTSTISTTRSTGSAPPIDPRMEEEATDSARDYPQFEKIDQNINNNEEAYQTVEILEENSVDSPREKRQIVYQTSPIPSPMPTTCGCYSPVLCPGQTDGTGLIDFRIVIGGVPTCTTGLQYCCPGNSPMPPFSCGTRFTPTVVYPLQQGQARYGDFPWMVAILTTDNMYVGGGVLIDTQNVLTTAHRIAQYPNGNGLKIRLGEWDTSGTYEQYPYRDYSVVRLWLHELFNPSTLQNDIAVIRLSGQVPLSQPIGVTPICMPTNGQMFEGQRCWVSGWGSDVFGTNGRYQNILKTVDLPIISSQNCENTLRTTRLGTGYILDPNSFICAGGEVSKDACTGDGGSGLVCETSPGRWVLAGLVSWGLGCATPGIPGAYVNVANFVPWIQARQTLP